MTILLAVPALALLARLLHPGPGLHRPGRLEDSPNPELGLVQAYSFTSVPILAALKAAHARDVDVEVIVDESTARTSPRGSRYNAVIYLSNAGIPMWVDAAVSIAHNKIMVIDDATVITGSFNFTTRRRGPMRRTCLLSATASLRRSIGRTGSGEEPCRCLMAQRQRSRRRNRNRIPHLCTGKCANLELVNS